MSGSGELTRMIRSEALSAQPVRVVAEENERAALARRFDLPTVHALEAQIDLAPEEDGIRATGSLKADFDQFCAVSGEPFRNRVEDDIDLRFVRTRPERGGTPDEEIELEAADLDDIEYDGEAFDLGEALAQSFALAIDPYAEGPDADTARKDAGLADEGTSGPFAALAALRKD